MLENHGRNWFVGDYEATFRTISDLSEDDSRAIVDLYLAHYDGSSESLVLTDLALKTEVLLLHCNGCLVGFTTLEVYEREWEGRSIRVVYSGDTVVAPAHWGQQALAFRWIARMGELKRERPDLPIYWLLIVKGHRTFKYLPTFGKSFFPHWSIDRSDLRALAQTLAREKFGSAYDPATGIVAFDESRGYLKQELALPSQAEQHRDSVKFFLERNPNYLAGHELVCLCEIEVANMRPLTRRIFLRKAS